MEACLAETEVTRPKQPLTVVQWLRYACIATIGIGLVWRLVRYVSGFPIWGDEAMLLVNILERDYGELTFQLRFAQVAPLLFLWLEKSAILLFGASEWSVHLFPFLAGLVSLFVFWHTCRKALPLASAGLAAAILAVSYYPVRHGCEVKPYAFDLMFAVLFLWLALGHLHEQGSHRRLLGLIVLAPIAVFTSYPSVFVGGAVSLVLLGHMRTATWTQRGLFVLFNCALCGAFLLHYGWIAQQHVDAEEAQRTREFLRDYWKDAFPPLTLSEWPTWLIKVFTGNMLAYPIGANHGGSTLTFLLVLLGSVTMWLKKNRALLALCALPFALNLSAAILGKYPFGDSARITLHLAPFICILMAHGLVATLAWIRQPAWRARLEWGCYLILFTCGAIGVARDVAKPYKTLHDREVRQLVRDLTAGVAPGAPIYLCHERDQGVLAEVLWYLRTERQSVDWLDAANLPRSCCLVRCSSREIEVSEVTALLPGKAWRVVASEVRHVPPENSVMASMYCRWVRVVRE